MKGLLRTSVLLAGLLGLPPALATTPEVEEAYEKGQADWDRGDLSSAMEPLKKAADGGHPVAQALYGFLLDQADDDLEAAEYYRKSAEQGNGEGMYGLATLYAAGEGVEQNLAEGLRWYLKAAEIGHRQSTIVVAMAYMQGGLGLGESVKESAEALRWVRAAAEVNHLPALRRLLEAYQKGEMGLAVDMAEAERLQQRIYEVQGIDPNATKKRRRRL